MSTQKSRDSCLKHAGMTRRGKAGMTKRGDGVLLRFYNPRLNIPNAT
jgi:hypothetical protein